MEEIIQKTVEFVKSKLQGEASGHDWWHVYRVWQNTKLILKTETEADGFVAELGALLHDICDWKFEKVKNEGSIIAKDFLSSLGVSEEVISQVCNIIETVSFKGANVANEALTYEAQIVQDADRLDAIGAIGVARTFAYGGFKNQEMYDPNEKPKFHNSFEEYKNSKSTSINHFYEKLLLLKDRMNTKSAIKIAEERHKFMEDFLNHFLSEWNGEM